MIGKQIIVLTPVLPEKLKPQALSDAIVRNKDMLDKQKDAEFYNKRHGSIPAAEYKASDTVPTKLDQKKV